MDERALSLLRSEPSLWNQHSHHQIPIAVSGLWELPGEQELPNQRHWKAHSNHIWWWNLLADNNMDPKTKPDFKMERGTETKHTYSTPTPSLQQSLQRNNREQFVGLCHLPSISAIYLPDPSRSENQRKQFYRDDPDAKLPDQRCLKKFLFKYK